MIDLDANATTAILPEVLDAMLPWLTGNHANPSGIYKNAKLARKAIDSARAQVADLIGAEPEEIVFTGSGTESVNTALHSLDTLVGKGNATVSAIEHSAVLRFVESRLRPNAEIPVTANGRINPTTLTKLLSEASYLSVMWANNETGVIQPVSEIVEKAKEHGLPIHTDAVQAVGKIPLNVRETAVDMLSLSAHKLHGPRGIGALYIRKNLGFAPYLLGGGQENGRRSGTENTAAIVAMGEAARLAKQALQSGIPDQISEIRNTFEDIVLSEVPGTIRNGDHTHRLPNTTHISFDACDSAGLLILLDNAGVACSAGSACMSGKQQPSHVQLAMGITPARAKTSLRFSFSRLNTLQEASEAASKVRAAVEKLRSVQGNGVGPVSVYTS
ncbi:MAG: cysteine desulfurase family protein [Luteolibacter sp.]